MLLRISALSVALSACLFAQGRGGAIPAPASTNTPTPATPTAAAPARDAGSDLVLKALEIQKWYLEMGDIAEVHEIRYTSLPPHKPTNPTAPGAKNPLIIRAMTFVPKNIDRSKKQPFMVFAH